MMFWVRPYRTERIHSFSAQVVQCTEGRGNGTLPWDWRRTALFTAFGAGYQGGAQYLIFNRALVRTRQANSLFISSLCQRPQQEYTHWYRSKVLRRCCACVSL
eukprot:1195638-Prorocentrum_minimum.AAC.7